MGLLHSLTQLGAKSSLWELVDLGEDIANELGIPLPPTVTNLLSKLPDISNMIGSGDPKALLNMVGPEVAQALGVQLDNPVLQNLVKGNLEGALSDLQNYLPSLDSLKGDLTGQLHDALGSLGSLQDLRGQLDSVLNIARDLPGALSDLTGQPILGEALNLLAQASPEVAQVLRLASDTAGQIDSQIRNVEDTISSVTGKLDSLSSLEGVTNLAIDQLSQHIEGLDTVFDAARKLLRTP